METSTRFLHATEMGVGAWAWGDKIIWNYGGSYSNDDVRGAFDISLEKGVRLVDTAEVYGRGRSERLIGEFLKETEVPVLLATKFMPFPWRFRKKALLRSLRRSLERLDVESVDLYQIHWPIPPISIETWMNELAIAVQEGLTRTVGVSNYDQSQMLQAYSALARHDIPLASNQLEYHLLDRRVEKNGLLARCKELDIRLIAYSPLGMGLLTGKYTVDSPPPGMRGRRFSRILPKLPPLLKLMTQIGQDHGGKSNAQIALNWLICKGTMPIPGAKNAKQAEANAGALGWQLTEDQVAALDETSEEFTKE
ncbi:MAG: aldo/keto reductase [Anaerolineae bacterium]|jgi:aryl-alcohol dehydrogenase-like predicted oxidoreductase|nr:aldo/keto reductase [Anaerolineae bacterium]MBT7990082.1 aldo/keto reductase [Anaerolineae bacterium]